MRKNIQGIGSLLWKSIRRAGLEDGVTAVLVIKEFEKVLEEEFGEKIKNKVKILYFKKKVLYLSALSSVVIQEIRMNEIQLLKRVNKKFDKRIAERLSFFSR